MEEKLKGAEEDKVKLLADSERVKREEEERVNFVVRMDRRGRTCGW